MKSKCVRSVFTTLESLTYILVVEKKFYNKNFEKI